MTVSRIDRATAEERLDRAAYLAALLTEVAGLLRRGVGERPSEEVLGMLHRDLGELREILGALRRERGA